MVDKTVAGCIITDENHGLLVLHRNIPGQVQWEIPGGKLKAAETPNEAAVREVWEELGVKVAIDDFLGKKQFTQDDVIYEYHWFLAKIVAGEPQIKESELFDKFGYLTLLTLSRRYSDLSANLKNLMEAIAYGQVELDI